MNPCLLAMVEVDGSFIAIVAVVGGIGIAIVSVVTSAIRASAERRQMEQSRREIAAYIAEGSMSPDEGERLLNAGKPPRTGCC